ncbi:unnamed protein product [Diatraea saccharalis]|uniref:Uncharacterized protein n=1 Tax=Diatraea saccharalis TaxID=40085 RepID=A0A9N9R6Y2_9NEOP|nr:unnamed protein product [Diatraea saccharalis]
MAWVLVREEGSDLYSGILSWPEEGPAEVDPEDVVLLDGSCPGPQFTLTQCMLRQLRSQCSLTSLALQYCNINCNTTGINHFPPTLKKLSLRGSKCYNLPLDKSFLFNIQDYLPQLEYLDLSECEWLEPASFLPLSKVNKLTHLILRDCHRMAEFVAYASLATRYGFRQLELLDVRGSPLGDSEVSALGWLPALQQLYLSPARLPPPAPPHHSHCRDERLPPHKELQPWEIQEPEYFQIKPQIVEPIDTRATTSIEDIEEHIEQLRNYENNICLHGLEYNLCMEGIRCSTRKRADQSVKNEKHTAQPSTSSKDIIEVSLRPNANTKDNAQNAKPSTSKSSFKNFLPPNVNPRDVIEVTLRPSTSANTNASSDQSKSQSDSQPSSSFKSNIQITSRASTSSISSPQPSTSSKIETGLFSEASTSSESNSHNFTQESNSSNIGLRNASQSSSSSEAQNSFPRHSISGDVIEITLRPSTSSSNDTQNPTTLDKIAKNVKRKSPQSGVGCKKSRGNSSEPPKDKAQSNDERDEPGPSLKRVLIDDQHIWPNYKKAEVPSKKSKLKDEPPKENRNSEDSSDDDVPLKKLCKNNVNEGASTSKSSAETPKVPKADTNQKKKFEYVRFRQNMDPVIVRRDADEVEAEERARENRDREMREREARERENPDYQNREARPRAHVLYVNVGQQLHTVYRLSIHNEPPIFYSFARNSHLRFRPNVGNVFYTPPTPRLDATSLVTDSAVRRFGKADVDDINIVNIGPFRPGGERGARPNKSNLRVLSITGFKNITNRSLEHLATAAPHLRSIDFSESGVTAAGVENFKSLRPDCEVIFSEYVERDENV